MAGCVLAAGKRYSIAVVAAGAGVDGAVDLRFVGGERWNYCWRGVQDLDGREVECEG